MASNLLVWISTLLVTTLWLGVAIICMYPDHMTDADFSAIGSKFFADQYQPVLLPFALIVDATIAFVLGQQRVTRWNFLYYVLCLVGYVVVWLFVAPTNPVMAFFGALLFVYAYKLSTYLPPPTRVKIEPMPAE